VYLVFARKYRPQRFDGVIGQAHVARTLQNAVRTGRVAHAYLFCGSRGIGKTTVARILARALNCKEGPTPDPCGQCESCRRIAVGNDIDVLEIDGASNRGIDEVRELRQNVKYAPARSRFKVYYIDEVHMLTAPAFNALLKTLEEPPPHVKFIFSTTDPQQLPETVRSRCQRFDFRRVSDADIVRHLGAICESEGLKAQKGVLPVLARAARGSVRDALGTLDQLAALSDEELGLEDALMILGAVKTQTLTDIADALAAGDAGRALATMHEVLTGGVDLLDFADQLSEYLRDLLLASEVGPEDELLAAAAADPEVLRRQSELFTADQLIYMIQIIREAKLRARRDTTGRLAMEVAVVKLSRLKDLVPLQQAIGRLASPAAGMAQGGSGAGGGGQTAPAAAPSPSSRVQGMMKKLQNRCAAPVDRQPQPDDEDAPEGIDPARFRQLKGAAEDRDAAAALKEDAPLLKAFVEADGQLGLQPLRLRKRRQAEQEESPGEQSPQ